MNDETHVSAEALESGLQAVESSPRGMSSLDLIVRRPGIGLRELPEEARLDEDCGLVGDGWKQRGSANPDTQITVMNSRAIEVIAGSRERWALAGDQLFVDLDLSTTNLPAGSRLRVGEAVIEITAEPHLGCAKFKARFGADALAAVNSPRGRELRLRGANARVVSGGVIRVGDQVAKI